MLILGFRCGTRRMEAHGLEVEDLTDRSSAWLWIRPTEARQLKTSNAKRQLPLCESFIRRNELDVLYSWKEKRIREGVSKECPYLFAACELNANGDTVTRQIPVQKLIRLIHRALRDATGDRSLHYHHLRHSFATRNITASRGRRSQPHRMKSMSLEKDNAGQSWCVAYPEIPHGKEDLKVIREWGGRFPTLQPSDGEAMRSVLGYYVHHVWKTSNVPLFHNPARPEDAVRYQCFLRALGVEDSQLRLVFFGQRRKSAFRRQWKDALNITWRWKGTSDFWKPPYGESAASERWLGIEPVFGSQPHGTGQQGSNGFRFLMVMAAIAFGYTGDE
jgi:Phage integrase family